MATKSGWIASRWRIISCWMAVRSLVSAASAAAGSASQPAARTARVAPRRMMLSPWVYYGVMAVDYQGKPLVARASKLLCGLERSVAITSPRTVATVDGQGLPRHERGGVRQEPQHGRRDLVRPADPPHWDNTGVHMRVAGSTLGQ